MWINNKDMLIRNHLNMTLSTSRYNNRLVCFEFFFFCHSNKDFRSLGSLDGWCSGRQVHLSVCGVGGADLVGIGLDSPSSGNHADASLITVGHLDWPTDLQAITETWGGASPPQRHSATIHNRDTILDSYFQTRHALCMPVYLVCVSGMFDSSDQSVSPIAMFTSMDEVNKCIFYYFGVKGWRRTNLYHCRQNRNLCVCILHGQTAVRL